jgi:hypothetical protein
LQCAQEAARNNRRRIIETSLQILFALFWPFLLLVGICLSTRIRHASLGSIGNDRFQPGLKDASDEN